MSWAVVLLAAVPPLRALELSLEQNRAERGSIGFVEIQKVFDDYPETQRAKEEFEGEVKRRGGEIQERKRALILLRSEVNRLEAERDFIKQTPMLIEPAPPPPPAPPPAPVESQPQAPPATGGRQAGENLEDQPRVIPPWEGLEGESEGAASTSAVVAVSTTPAQSAPLTPSEAKAPPPPPQEAQVSTETLHSLPGLAVQASTRTFENLRLAEERLGAKRQELARAEASLREFLTSAERELAEMERKKSRTLLGRIYRIVREVAAEEGVSVVVDKANILYGHDAVDLTQKLLDRLHAESKR